MDLPLIGNLTFEDRLGLLIDREITDRQNHRLVHTAYRINRNKRPLSSGLGGRLHRNTHRDQLSKKSLPQNGLKLAWICFTVGY